MPRYDQRLARRAVPRRHPAAGHLQAKLDSGVYGEEAMTARRKTRCGWCGEDPTYVAYHDDEWGVPVHDDRKLFEMLVLEGAQAGLSWITVLRKRAAYREAFAGFDPERVARFTKAKEHALLQNPGIIRNRAKVASAIQNARAFLDVQEEFGSFDAYQWRFVDGRPLQNRIETLKELPARTAVSDAFSKDLKRRGFSFVGSTIMYAHMQAVGMVNDHVVGCFRRGRVALMR
jgi:DNA-3-methyladenine glycosylase I